MSLQLTRKSYVAPLALLLAVTGCGAPSNNTKLDDRTRAQMAEASRSRGDDAAKNAAAGNHDSARDPLTHASALIAAGDIDAGISEAKIALALHRDDLKLSLEVGRLAVRTGRLADALDIYRQIAERHPNSPEALNGEGVVLAQKGDLDTAAVELKKALALRPQDVPIRNNLALVMLLRGDANGAMGILQPVDIANAPPELKAALEAASKGGAVMPLTPPPPTALVPRPVNKADNDKPAATPLAASGPAVVPAPPPNAGTEPAAVAPLPSADSHDANGADYSQAAR